MNIKDKWETRYETSLSQIPDAAEVLERHQHLLPSAGIALDLACGRGGNALCLARNGLDTHAWDISANALSQLQALSKNESLMINTEARDVSSEPPLPDQFDVIVVSRFLDRNLIPALKKSIRKQGLLFYQTFIIDKVSAAGPNNPDYLLQTNELLRFFNDWRVLVYHEEGSVGDTSQGFRNYAMLIAQKQ